MKVLHISNHSDVYKLKEKIDDVKALVAIERPGRNEKNVYHNCVGEDVSDLCAPIDYLFEEAKLLTVGIGDVGNEVGMGNIRYAVKKYHPFGAVCRCPCKGGIASIVGCDELVVSLTSNWGAYALAFGLSALSGVELDLDGEKEKKMLENAVQVGLVDGLDGIAKPSVDGIPSERSADVVQLMANVAENLKT